MAAPCWRYTWRPLWRISSESGWRIKPAVRNVSSVAQRVKAAGAPSPWVLHGAVCLQRLPVISQDRSPMEERFVQLMRQMELERSVLSDHELRLLDDAERMSRKKEGDYDSDDEGYGGQEIITAQDLEDTWDQKLKQFQPAERMKVSGSTDMNSAQRCLDRSLLLLVKQDVGSQKLWLLPQTPWEAGETLRQTAERALHSLAGADLKATFLGNAPCGFYKYKYPKSMQTESRVGAKVFFFKAVLSGSSLTLPKQDSFVWARKNELPDYLKPEYLKQVNRFFMNL